MYSLKKSDNMLIEKKYYENGAKLSQGIYFNEAGRVTSYDMTGKITEEYDQNFQEGKLGFDCNCQ
jgi:antitoxin component YwqK of YwqJK toxin-antitoxin module